MPTPAPATSSAISEVFPALSAYLAASVPGLGAADTLSPIGEGHSNPTFVLRAGDRPLAVLRKQPPGKLLPSAHAIDREFRVMQALAETEVPVPEMLHYCEDAEVIGTPFYLMEYLDGRVFLDNALPGQTPAERAAIFEEMAATLVKLHQVDLSATGLDSYVKHGGFLQRQIQHWHRQYESGEFRRVAEIDELGKRLLAHCPEDSGPTTLVHGDYRLGNLMFDKDKPRVIAVLDWELSTLGDPLSDLGYNLMTWVMDKSEFAGLGDHDISALGIPARHDYCATYFQARGLPGPLPPFYVALAFYRLAVIFEGIASRVARGAATGEHSAAAGKFSQQFAHYGLTFTQE